jgi:uncharacterized protein YndB with AHSA1/START domain
VTDPIDLRFELDEPADKVWRALTTPALLARWLGPNDIHAKVGARFTVQTGEGANDNGAADCEVLDLEPGRLLRFSWREAGPDGVCFDSVVTFVLTATGEGSHLRLTHDGFAVIAAPAPSEWRMQWAA